MKRTMMAAIAAVAMMAMTAGWQARAAEDTRQLVKLPPMMQEHMMGNMRDHLRALNEIFGALAAGKVDKAADIAEQRLGMSSLGKHGAEHMAQFMPKGMQAIGTGMHKAASQFVIVARDAELAPGREAMRKTFGALKVLTDSCIACHAAYRLR